MKTKKLKLSTVILTSAFILMVLGVFASNLVLKDVYKKIDKGDVYWNYNRVLEQPFKHLKINGGNITNIVFEQNKKSSLKVLSDWYQYKKDVTFTARVNNDTLYVNFPNNYNNAGEREWMRRTVLIRLFTPQLLSINGVNTNLALHKLNQSAISVNISGKSMLGIESYSRNFNVINITEADSSQVIFKMSPELNGSKNIHFGNVTAHLKNYSLLEIGHGYADKLDLNIADSSAVTLSGRSLKSIQK